MNRFLLILTSILLTGGILLCAIRWQAWFGNPPEPYWQSDTIDYRFYTFGDDSVPGFEHDGLYWQDLREPDTLQILLFADVHNALGHSQWQQIGEWHPQTDCYAQLGDWVERGYFYYNQQLYHDLQGTAFEEWPVINVPGNHEYRKGVIRRLPDYWLETFRHPLNGPKESLGLTYYVDFPRLRFIVIDTNGLHHLHERTRTNTWLKTVIKTAGDRFVVAMMHHPVHSSAKGRFNPATFLTFARPLAKADVVFAGHDHNYFRRMPYINASSTTKVHERKARLQDSLSILPGTPLYELIKVYGDTLRVETRQCDTGELCDEVTLVKSIE